MQNIGTILVVEARPEDARTLNRCLMTLKVKFRSAISAEQAIQLLQRMVFQDAIVAAELNLREQPMIAYVSCLPATRLLLATGPADDWEMEKRARFAGADFYLSRPVTTEALAMAFQMSLRGAGLIGPSCSGPPTASAAIKETSRIGEQAGASGARKTVMLTKTEPAVGRKRLPTAEEESGVQI